VKYIHPHFGIKVDTESMKYKDLFKDLKSIYDDLPKTKCLHCPNKEKVEADCCKTFSPPMLLSEFLSISTILETLSKEEQDKLTYYCFESFLSNEIVKQCPLLENDLCKSYYKRPLSCRLFGIYSDSEYNDRLKNVCESLKLKKEDVPFYEQCKNLEVKGMHSFPKQLSDKLFEKIHRLDIRLFDDKIVGKEIVEMSATYMPFDAHYLCVRIGPDNLEILTSMKLELKKSKEKYNANPSIDNSLEYSSLSSKVKDFLEEVKKNIFGDNLDER